LQYEDQEKETKSPPLCPTQMMPSLEKRQGYLRLWCALLVGKFLPCET